MILSSNLTFGINKFQLADFAIQLEQITSAPTHVWVSSGFTTVNPQYHTVVGVNEFYAPPLAAKKFSLKTDIRIGQNIIPDNGSEGKGDVGILYAGGVWYPHKIVRYGTYHHMKDGKLVSLGVTTELIPLFGHAGFIEKITIKNRTSQVISLEIVSEATPGTPAEVPLREWGFSPPEPNVSQAQQTGTDRWANESAVIGIYRDNATMTIEPGQSAVSTITIVMTAKNSKLPELVNAKIFEAESVNAWQQRLDTYTKNIPSLSSNIEGLNDYYKRSLVSGLVCIWENPTFALNPHFATSGIDGGSLCTYLWDNAGYNPQTVALMFDTKTIDLAKKMASIDLEKYNAFAADGSGVGVKYSYSPMCFIGLVNAIFKYIGPDKELFEYGKCLILNNEKRKSSNNLIDYGFQHNLLEMRGTGWEHMVVSPNTERSWCLRQLSDMGKLTGASQAERTDWEQQADKIITSVRKELWDEKAQWFACLYPDGYKDYVYSIQVYDALYAGACTPAQEKVLISQLRDGAYLGKYGVSSISKTDSVHFEVVDTDWSGGGAYSGDGPQLALMMYEKGYSQIAWDVLKRHFWMGKHQIYFPQEHYCDRPMSPTNKRANIAAGLCGVETILFGLIGFQPQYNGELYINPQPNNEGNIDIKGFVFRKNTFDISLSAKKLFVRRDGRTVYEGVPKRVRIR